MQRFTGKGQIRNFQGSTARQFRPENHWAFDRALQAPDNRSPAIGGPDEGSVDG